MRDRHERAVFAGRAVRAADPERLGRATAPRGVAVGVRWLDAASLIGDDAGGSWETIDA